jgi:hypothetical protein
MLARIQLKTGDSVSAQDGDAQAKWLTVYCRPYYA